MIYQFFLISADAKMDEEGEKLQLLTDDNGGAQGMGTQSAITVIGSGIFLFFILACCIAICCKYK